MHTRTPRISGPMTICGTPCPWCGRASARRRSTRARRARRAAGRAARGGSRSIPGASIGRRPGRVRHGAHQDREQHEVGAHGRSRCGRPGRTPRARARRRTSRTASAASAPARRGGRPPPPRRSPRRGPRAPAARGHQVELGSVLGGSPAATSCAGRASPSRRAARRARPTTIPTDGPPARPRRRSPPRPRRRDLAPAGHQPHREAGHRGREHDVEPEDRGSGIALPSW